MTDMRWRTVDGQYALIVGSRCWKRIEHECARSRHLETGGILIGYYTPDNSTAMVTGASSPPKDSKRGPTWFQRGVAGLSSVLRRLWYHPRRSYYIGEWHYHPSVSVKPSRDDIVQMVKISESTDYQCKEPIMLVVGEAVNGRRLARALVFPAGTPPVEMRFLETLGPV